MKHPSLHEVELDLSLAEAADRPMTVDERRARWADALEAWPHRIRSFDSIELTPRAHRAHLRADGSALAVAFADPVLRAEGLRGDTYQDGRAFFDLSHGDMHRLMCRCHIGASETSARTAARLRRMQDSPFSAIGRTIARMTQAVSARFA